jgi:hypothetical protein
MDKRINDKIKNWSGNFKKDLAGKLHETLSLSESDKLSLLEYIYAYQNIEIRKEDIQKRTRVKNIVPFHDRCRACRANGEQCTRRKKSGEKFCGTHIKGIPHGEITNGDKQKDNKIKIQIWAQEINGIIKHLDKNGNVYDPQDIYQNIENPRVISKWKKEGETYVLY